MRVAYIDCFAGISGDMFVGAMIDAGVSFKELEQELLKLQLPGFRLEARKTERRGISGTKFDVFVEEEGVERHLNDILKIIESSRLDEDVKAMSSKAFELLAAAEAEVHGTDISKIHFHELGGVDTIVDIVSAVICIKKLGIDKFFCSSVNTGSGFVRCEHGILPVPAPATLKLLKGFPIYSSGIQAELTTPTGAAILKLLAPEFVSIPEIVVECTGYGAGTRELEIPNLLRVILGQERKKAGCDSTATNLIAGSREKEISFEEDEVLVIETNIDNTSSEILGYALETLLKKGALDVFFTPIFMKKNRPATMVSIIVHEDKLDQVLASVFDELPTLGVRISRVERKKLHREIIKVNTRWGEVEVKLGKSGSDVKTVIPEYESCKEIAVRAGVPLKGVYDEVKAVLKRRD